jgi:hypothetical protein
MGDALETVRFIWKSIFHRILFNFVISGLWEEPEAGRGRTSAPRVLAVHLLIEGLGKELGIERIHRFGDLGVVAVHRRVGRGLG